MSITSTLMEIGSWDLQLREGAPQSVRNLLDDWYSLLTITSQRLPVTVASTITKPLFRGPMLERRGDLAISGADSAWYLGSPDPTTVQTSGFGAWISTLWSSSSIATVMGQLTAKNGMSWAANPSVTGTINGGLNGTPRTGLDTGVCKSLGCEWRIGPDLKVLLYKALDYAATNIIMTDDVSGSEPGMLSWHVSAVNPDLSVTALRNREVTRAAGPSDQATAVPSDSRKVYGGAQLEVAGYSSTSESGMGPASNLLVLDNRVARDLTVTVDDWSPVAKAGAGMVLPGSGMRVYIPSIGVYDNTVSYPTVWRGRYIWPAWLRCTQVKWPIERGLGVYLDNRHQGGVMTDITDWVAWESAGTDFTFGSIPKWFSGASRSISG